MRMRCVVTVLVLACAASGVASAETVERIDDGDFHATPDVRAFVLDIAGPTATAPGGDAKSDRVVMLARKPNGELAVTAMQAVADGQAPDLPDGTVAILIARHAGACQPPHGEDYRGLFKRIFTFVVDYRGRNVWEIGYAGGQGSIRLVKAANDFGPEETFNIDPSKYATYPCAKYD